MSYSLPHGTNTTVHTTHRQTLLLLLLLLLLLYSLSHLYRVFTIINLKQTIFTGYIVLQPLCIYNMCYV